MKSMKALAAALTEEQRRELLALLQKSATLPFSTMTASNLACAERWFTRRMAETGAGRYIHSRTRLWLIFMLLRHGGLRLREIMNLAAPDFDFDQCQIMTNGRLVRFSRKVARRIVAIWNAWPGRASSFPLRCESSQVRRAFARCAEACAIPQEQLNARALRRLRGEELEAGGLHPRLAAWFLGQAPTPAPFDTAQANYLLNLHINTEGSVKTSARNSFQGQITKVRENGILVEVELEMEGGLKLVVLITETSRKSLRLAPGKMATALVKAPWVTVLPMEDRAMAPDMNCFEGTVESLQRDALACEIMISLKNGNQVCALYANGAHPSDRIEINKPVVVSFSPFSVILTES